MPRPGAGALPFPCLRVACKIANHTGPAGASRDAPARPATMTTTQPQPVTLSERPMGRAHAKIVVLCFFAWIFDFYDLII
jgi:hypothetical protein